MTHTLLLVDDSEDHRFITMTELKRIKTSPQFQLQEASRGEEALQALEPLVKSGSQILVLADYRMPRMTGLDLVKAVRAKYPNKRIRFVVYSSTDQGIAEEARALGADEFIVKPMDLQQFRTALKRLVDEWYGTTTAKAVRRTI